MESQNIEYKLKWDDKYLQWISGFANGNGGKLEIGKNDNGELVGLSKAEAKQLIDLLPNKISTSMAINPKVNLHKFESENGEAFYVEID